MYIYIYIYIFVVQDFWTIIRTIPIDRFEWRPLTGGFVPLSRTSFRWIIGGSPADSHNVCCLMWIFVYCIRMCDLIWIYLILYIYGYDDQIIYIYIHMINLIIHVHIHNTPLELFWWDCGKLLASNFESFCMRLRCSCGAPLVVMTQEQLSLEKKHIGGVEKEGHGRGMATSLVSSVGQNAWVHCRCQICGIWRCFLWWCTVTGKMKWWDMSDRIQTQFMNPINRRLEDILSLQEPMVWNKHVEAEVGAPSVPQQKGYSIKYKTYQNILNCMQRLCDATRTQFCPQVII